MIVLRLPARWVCLALPLCLPACHLVGQRDFNANAGKRPEPHAAAMAALPPTPSLVTIRYTTPDPDYREALADAVRKALARKPDVLFTVATLVPLAKTADGQADQAAEAADSGKDVAQTIVDAGAQPGQIEQLVTTDPGASVREVRVTVQ